MKNIDINKDHIYLNIKNAIILYHFVIIIVYNMEIIVKL
jgi:hypothetical protein